MLSATRTMVPCSSSQICTPYFIYITLTEPLFKVGSVILIYLLMLIFLPKNKIDIMQRMIVTLCIISIPFFQSFSKRYSKTNLKIDIPSENIHFRMQVYKGKNYFILPKVALNSLNKYLKSATIIQYTIKGRFMSR